LVVGHVMIKQESPHNKSRFVIRLISRGDPSGALESTTNKNREAGLSQLPCNSIHYVAGATRLELATSGVTGRPGTFDNTAFWSLSLVISIHVTTAQYGRVHHFPKKR